MKRAVVAARILVIAAFAAVYSMGSLLAAPATRPVGEAPGDLGAVNVEFGSIKGWFIPAADSNACVILMHGVRGDRRSMIERARFLRAAGYSSLLFDFQAHGESPGEHITFGYLESTDARAAVAVARDRFHCRHVAALGQSLGGAAALLGQTPLQVEALIIESVYPTFEEAAADRMRIRLGEFGALLAPLLTLQLQPRFGIRTSDLRPIDAIARFRRPLFVMAGTEDQHTRLEESRRLFAAAREPKEFWAVQGAAHVDLYRFAPDVYRQRVLGFLANHVPTRTAQQPAQ